MPLCKTELRVGVNHGRIISNLQKNECWIFESNKRSEDSREDFILNVSVDIEVRIRKKYSLFNFKIFNTGVTFVQKQYSVTKL
jgi:hypothetical protein